MNSNATSHFMTQYFNELSALNNHPLLDEIRSNKNWQSRYSALLKFGKLVTTKPELHRSSFEVSGCEAKLWVTTENNNGVFHFTLDSESRIIKALAALILLELHEKTPKEIMCFDIEHYLNEQGFDRYLSPSRNSGLSKLAKLVIKQVK